MSDLGARCPDCGHLWFAHAGDTPGCAVEFCDCEEQLEVYAGTQTLVVRADGLAKVTTVWPERQAYGLAHALRGAAGPDAQRACWNYFIARVERLLAGGRVNEWQTTDDLPPV